MELFHQIKWKWS